MCLTASWGWTIERLKVNDLYLKKNYHSWILKAHSYENFASTVFTAVQQILAKKIPTKKPTENSMEWVENQQINFLYKKYYSSQDIEHNLLRRIMKEVTLFRRCIFYWLLE